jgi:drug/metabolite transporter (DMT)-like permease
MVSAPPGCYPRRIPALVVASVSFGIMAVVVRLATQGMAAPQVAFVRFAGSFLVLLVLSRGRGLRPREATTPRLVLRGALGSISILFYFVGLGGGGAGLATLLHCTYPVSTAAFGILFLGMQPRWRVGAALLVSFAGAALVVADGLEAGGRVVLGSAVSLLAGMFAGGAVATASALRRTEDATLVTVYFMGVGALATAPALLLGVPPWSAELAMALGGVVAFSTLGQWLLHHGLGHTSAITASLITATSIVTAAVAEAAVFGTQISPRVGVAGLLMMIAVGLASERQ